METAAREAIARARYIRLMSRVTSQSRTVSTAIAAKAAVVAYWLTVMKTPWLTVSRTVTEATNCSVSRCIRDLMTGRPLRVLILEDRPEDAELVVLELRRAGYELNWRRVDD